MLTENSTRHLISGGGGGAHPLHPPPRSAPADCHCELLFDSSDLLSESDVLKLSPAEKNCNLDPMPTKLVAECLDVLLPVISTDDNLFPGAGHFSRNGIKEAITTPLIKKPGLNSEFLNEDF